MHGDRLEITVLRSEAVLRPLTQSGSFEKNQLLFVKMLSFKNGSLIELINERGGQQLVLTRTICKLDNNRPDQTENEAKKAAHSDLARQLRG